MHGKVQSIINVGANGHVVDIECHLSNSLPNIVIVGCAAKAVDESKERLRGAFASCQLQLPRKRITINLAPADLPKDDSGFDLGIAVAILAAANPTIPVNARAVFIGELGLDGSVRSVRGIIGKLLAGRDKDFTTFFVPAQNLEQARLVPHINLIPVQNLRQLFDHLTADRTIPSVDTKDGAHAEVATTRQDDQVLVSDIVGQPQAKRALEIAAAGGHNVFFNGPPGTGKSMLARALSSILPPLTHEEMLEVTHMHSLANHSYDTVITARPFRSPHHSASHVAVIGGGHSLRPGEISLSHRGVLFFDELPEFSRITLEALRQPLEDRTITVARAKDSVEYPANFILIATANPCPCGYYGTSKPCSCLPYQIQRYQQRLSGPIMDRIDLYSNVSDVEHAKLITTPSLKSHDEAIRARVLHARQLQQQRYGTSTTLNSNMSNNHIKKLAQLTPDAKTLLDTAAERLNISARSYMRTIKVARTVADLDSSEQIRPEHLTEALQYRQTTQKL
ncbi:MAG TPA: YifB family Mg chelatase-like AAA ATPase [Candidatus Saccharimonadales bacterium]|nr:YifB family Mg chelatase-like AAA ATPase [Candidatus Saccharimonadales bacterium]